MKKSVEECFAVTAPGLEEVCAKESALLGLEEVRIAPGGVAFRGDLRALYRANLWLRTAGRVVVRLGELGCRDFPDLHKKALRLPWGRFIRPGTALRVRAMSRRSRLVHTGRIEETVADAAARALGAQALQGEQLVLVRMEDDRCVISIDSSGELLHRRGYRLHGGAAPLRETLAAGLLGLLQWQGEAPLLDPMCGSGTIAVEGALLARRMAPGRHRSFAFMQWPGWRPGLWEALQAEADRAVRSAAQRIVASDGAPAVLHEARRNAERAGVGAQIDFHCRDLADVVPGGEGGLVLCNPPYGERLGAAQDLRPLFRTLGGLGRRFGGWQVAFLAPDEAPARATGLPVIPVARLSNGGIGVTLFAARLD